MGGGEDAELLKDRGFLKDLPPAPIMPIAASEVHEDGAELRRKVRTLQRQLRMVKEEAGRQVQAAWAEVAGMQSVVAIGSKAGADSLRIKAVEAEVLAQKARAEAAELSVTRLRQRAESAHREALHLREWVSSLEAETGGSTVAGSGPLRATSRTSAADGDAHSQMPRQAWGVRPGSPLNDAEPGAEPCPGRAAGEPPWQLSGLRQHLQQLSEEVWQLSSELLAFRRRQSSLHGADGAEELGKMLQRHARIADAAAQARAQADELEVLHTPPVSLPPTLQASLRLQEVAEAQPLPLRSRPSSAARSSSAARLRDSLGSGWPEVSIKETSVKGDDDFWADMEQNFELAEQLAASHERRGTELAEQLAVKRHEVVALKSKLSALIPENTSEVTQVAEALRASEERNVRLSKEIFAQQAEASAVCAELRENFELAEQLATSHERRNSELSEQLTSKRRELVSLKAKQSAHAQDAEAVLNASAWRAEEVDALEAALEDERAEVRVYAERLWVSQEQHAHLAETLEKHGDARLGAQVDELAAELVSRAGEVREAQELEARAAYQVRQAETRESSAVREARLSQAAFDRVSQQCDQLATDLARRAREVQELDERRRHSVHEVAELSTERQGLRSAAEERLLQLKASEEATRTLQAELDGVRDDASSSLHEATVRILELEVLLSSHRVDGKQRVEAEETGRLQMLAAQLANARCQEEETRELRKELHALREQLAAREKDSAVGASEAAASASELRLSLEEHELAAAAKVRHMEQRLKASEAAGEELHRQIAGQLARLRDLEGAETRAAERAASLEAELAQCREGLEKAEAAGGQRHEAELARQREAVQCLSEELERQREAALARQEEALLARKKGAELARLQELGAEEGLEARRLRGELQAAESSREELEERGRLLEAEMRTQLRDLDPSLGHALRGVSVHHLSTELLEQICGAGLGRESSVYEVEEGVVRRRGRGVVCPRDGRPGAAYVDTVHGVRRAGVATHLLSCAGATPVGEVVGALDEYCRNEGLDPQRTYVWICALCANLHRPNELWRSPEVLEAEVAGRLRAIPRVLALLSPWQEPRYFTRLWCTAELRCALSLAASGACHVRAILPQSELRRIGADLQAQGAGIDAAWQAWQRLDAREAGLAEDRSPLVRLAAKDRDGESRVAGHLHSWLAALLELQVRALLAGGGLRGEPAARLCDRVGWLLREVGLVDVAGELLQDGLQLSLETASGSSDVSMEVRGGVSRREIYRAMTTLEVHQLAAWVLERVPNHGMPSVATLLTNMGVLKASSGDPAGALEAFGHARRIREATGTMEGPAGAVLLQNVGYARGATGDRVGAHEACEESHRIRVRTGMLLSPGRGRDQRHSAGGGGGGVAFGGGGGYGYPAPHLEAAGLYTRRTLRWGPNASSSSDGGDDGPAMRGASFDVSPSS